MFFVPVYVMLLFLSAIMVRHLQDKSDNKLLLERMDFAQMETKLGTPVVRQSFFFRKINYIYKMPFVVINKTTNIEYSLVDWLQ